MRFYSRSQRTKQHRGAIHADYTLPAAGVICSWDSTGAGINAVYDLSAFALPANMSLNKPPEGRASETTVIDTYITCATLSLSLAFSKRDSLQGCWAGCLIAFGLFLLSVVSFASYENENKILKIKFCKSFYLTLITR